MRKVHTAVNSQAEIRGIRSVGGGSGIVRTPFNKNNMELIEKIRAEIEKWLKEYAEDSQFELGEHYGYKRVLSFLDTLREPEHPIYQLNQILIDWVKEAPTDKEKDAREEAHKRFFDLYDEAMMQEPEVDLEKELESFIKSETPYGTGGYGDMMRIAKHFYNLGKNSIGIQDLGINVNLEKEVEQWLSEQGIIGMKRLWMEFARHCYELGKNAK